METTGKTTKTLEEITATINRMTAIYTERLRTKTGNADETFGALQALDALRTEFKVEMDPELGASLLRVARNSAGRR